MKGQVAFEALGALSDGLILEAIEVLGFSEDASPAFAAPRRRERTALSRFFGTGWGVALLCAVVSLSVLGGIIWAGQRPPAGGPGGSETETTADETLDYMGEEQTDVWVRSGGETVYPRKFFVWSGPADGYGFHDFVTQQGREPILPRIYVTKGEDCGIILANRYYLLKSVTAYDENLQPVIEANASGQNWSFASFIGDLPAGTYHVSLYVEYAKNGQSLSGADYACTVVVKDETTDTQEVISEEEAMEIASAYWNIQSGETSPDNGFTYRIECQKTHVTPGGETVYVVLWRWFVDGHHWSTVDVIWVDCVTGEVIIPYENPVVETEPETEPHVHEYSEGVVLKVSTCSEKGEMKRVCLTCGDVKIEALPTAPHTEVVDAAVPPTITESGLSEGKHCSVCGKVLVKQSVVAATGHTDLAYEINEDGRTCTITGMGACTATEIYIPSQIDGYKVTRIGEIAFIGKPLTAVHFPSSVTEIHDGAFHGCTELTEITLPSSITHLGAQVFQGCTGLTAATLQCRITELPHMIFEGCTSLASVTLPGTLTLIRIGAFSNCTALRGITLPASLGIIGPGAFQHCTSLTNVILPSKLSILDDAAFEGCISLTEMVLPDTLNRIGANAFSGCSGITAITVPAGVKQAEPSAFERMEGLTDIYFRGTEAEWNAIGYIVGENVQIHFGA